VYGVVPVVDAVAVWHDAEGELVLFAVNRDEQRPAPLAIELHCVVGVRSVTGAVVADDDPSAMNSETAPDRIRPRLLESVDAKLAVDGNTVSVTVPALSWTLLRVGVAAR